MSIFTWIALRDDLPSEQTSSPGHSKQTKARLLSRRWAALLLLLATSASVVTTPTQAAGASPGAGQVAFFGDLGNDFGSGEPFLRDASYFLVRPSSLLLTEDGSVDLEHLRWSGWGTSVAHATGVWSASDDNPDQASGKRITSPVELTLTSLGIVLGHRLYRCFRITFPHPPKPGMGDHECLHRNGTYQGHDHYGYQ